MPCLRRWCLPERSSLRICFKSMVGRLAKRTDRSRVGNKLGRDGLWWNFNVNPLARLLRSRFEQFNVWSSSLFFLSPLQSEWLELVLIPVSSTAEASLSDFIASSWPDGGKLLVAEIPGYQNVWFCQNGIGRCLPIQTKHVLIKFDMRNYQRDKALFFRIMWLSIKVLLSLIPESQHL